MLDRGNVCVQEVLELVVHLRLHLVEEVLPKLLEIGSASTRGAASAAGSRATTTTGSAVVTATATPTSRPGKCN